MEHSVLRRMTFEIAAKVEVKEEAMDHEKC
jgi:hypothetical protein